MRKATKIKVGAEQTQSSSPRHRIIYVGNFRPAFSTENDLKKSLEKIGCEVVAIQEDEAVALGDEGVQKILDASETADFVLYTRTWADAGKMWKEVMKKIKKPTVAVHLDLYISLDRGENLDNDPFFKCDYVFSADGGHDAEFKKFGINHIFMPPAILDESCHKGKQVEKFKYDVIFVGSYNYHKEWDYRRLLINWLRETYGSRFCLFGTHDVIRGEELNNLYASAKVVMGDSTYSPNYWSDRIPETIGRGGFLIHHCPEGLEKQFTPYKHFLPYNVGDFKTLKEIIDYYIDHPEEREKIAQAGMEWVKKEHTYLNRAEQIVSYLENKKVI